MSDVYGPVVHVRCKPGEEVRVVNQSDVDLQRAVGLTIEARDKIREAVDILEQSDVKHTQEMVRLDQILQRIRDWIDE